MKNIYTLFAELPDKDYEYLIHIIKAELQNLCIDDYTTLFNQAEIVEFEDSTDKSHSFLFDCNQEYERVVAVYGLTKLSKLRRNYSRQSKFVGAFSTIKEYEDYDKGHFIPHSNGGKLDHNLYPQLKELNRGLNNQGKLYRAMERYCMQNQNIFFFIRPVYKDSNWIPFYIDFGIFTKEKGLLFNRFDNRKQHTN